MIFSFRSLLAALVIVSSAPFVQGQLDGIADSIPENCRLSFDEAFDCVLANFVPCIGLVTIADSIAIPDPETVTCTELQVLYCDVVDACPVCATEFNVFIDCVREEVATGTVSLPDGMMGEDMMDDEELMVNAPMMNMTGCEEINMNMTDSMNMTFMNVSDCMNMTDSPASEGDAPTEGSVIVDPELANCALAAEVCS